MDIFLPQTDKLSHTIQREATDLLNRLRTLPVDKLGLPYHCLEYFKSSHFRRLFFSIETSAHLLHRSIRLSGKPVEEIVIMDYGAGVGTLYMLAKMIGCKAVIYNDHLEDWKISAVLIAEAIGVDSARLPLHRDEYIVGDIGDTLELLKEKHINCDIITSRNVIEHIYDLKTFFTTVAAYQPGAFIYSSTTANYHNPAAHIKHVLWHRKWEKQFLPQRAELIRKKLGVQGNKRIAEPGNSNPNAGANEIANGVMESEVQELAKATRGLALQDFDNALEVYLTNKTLPDPSLHHSNTVETSSGVWFEHLLPFNEYRALVPSNSYDLQFEPGFWDTHNTSKLKNLLGKVLNPIVKSSGAGGIRLAPFIYVIALPKSKDGRRINDKLNR